MNASSHRIKPDFRLLLGPLAAFILAASIVGLGAVLPNYSHVRQTVSEIGELDSPARIPFTAAISVVALCLMIFGLSLRDFSRRTGHSPWAAYLVIAMAISSAGVGVFAHPHPLHNVFGHSELIGYQAPLAFALGLRGTEKIGLRLISWVAWGLIWAAVVLNLSSIDSGGLLWAYVAPKYGLAQRALFAIWFGWCTVVGVVLFRRESQGLWRVA